MIPVAVDAVHKSFRQGQDRVPALRGVSLEVDEGRFVAIMGASGSGKSTLLHLIGGLTRPDEGRIVIRGTAIHALSDRELTTFRRRQIGLVFQSFNLIPTLTAGQNAALPLTLDGQSTAEANRRASQWLDELGLGHRRTHRPDAMSGGEQQRVAIARALVTDPAVILADEPTGNLDSANGRAVCDLLRRLAGQGGRTIVMVTHEPTVAAYADEVVVLKDGRTVDRFDTRPAAPGSNGDDLPSANGHAPSSPSSPPDRDRDHAAATLAARYHRLVGST